MLDEALNHPVRSVRRAAFDWRSAEHLGTKPLSAKQLRACLDDAELALRAGRLLKAQASRWPASERAPIVEALSRSSRAELRLASLELAVSFALPSVDARVRQALTDPSRSVRQHARYHLREAGVDFRDAYRDGLPASLGAIAGLGDVGTPDDWEALVESLEGPTRIACEALHAMRILNARESLEMRLFMVGDARAKVSWAARSSVEREIRACDEATIRAHLTSPFVHVRRSAIRLASFLPRWRAATLIAPAIAPDTLSVATLALGRWRAGPNPSADELDAWRIWMLAVGVDEGERKRREVEARWRFGILV